jgi:hypothetical protein
MLIFGLVIVAQRVFRRADRFRRRAPRGSFTPLMWSGAALV